MSGGHASLCPPYKETITLLRLLLPLRELAREIIGEHLDARGARAAGRGDEMHRAFGLLPALENDLDLTRRHRVADDELRQIRDAETREQRRHHGLAIVDAERTAGPHRGLLAGGVGVVPDIRRR